MMDGEGCDTYWSLVISLSVVLYSLENISTCLLKEIGILKQFLIVKSEKIEKIEKIRS